MASFSIRSAVRVIFGLVAVVAAQNAADGNNPTYTSDQQFQQQMVDTTNNYRSMYGAGSVEWNQTLAAYAQNAANSCVFKHTGGPYGENIAEGYSSSQTTCEAWGDERSQYSWQDAAFTEATGHFTQLVWKDTAEVGCGRKYCGADHGWYVVCEYSPRGNIIGSFASQVGTLVSGSGKTPSSTKGSSTIPLQTVAAASGDLPMFTGAAERKRVGSGMAMVGVLGALVAFA